MGAMVTENLTPGGTAGRLQRRRALPRPAPQHRTERPPPGLHGLPALRPVEQRRHRGHHRLPALPAVRAPTTAATGDSLNFLGMLLYGSGMFPLPAPAAESSPPRRRASRPSTASTSPPSASAPAATGRMSPASRPAPCRRPCPTRGPSSPPGRKDAVRPDHAHGRAAQRRSLHRGHALAERRQDDRRRPGRAVRVSQGAD